MEAGRDLRRSMTLSDQLAVPDSANLRDHLKVRDDDGAPGPAFRRRETLGAAFAAEKRDALPSSDAGGRSLLDIIRGEQVGVASAGTDAAAENAASGVGINWKSFKERLRIRRFNAELAAASDVEADGDADADTDADADADAEADAHADASPHPNPVPVPAPNPALAFGRSMSRSVSVRPVGFSVPESPAAAAAASSSLGSDCGAAAAEPVRISLMALLEQTDRHWTGGEGEEDAVEKVEAAEEEDDDEDDTAAVAAAAADDSGGGMHTCCVCMVRHKGAAFIPCGHTFCRLCSRELWVSRGNCPLCNGFILEILDIF